MVHGPNVKLFLMRMFFFQHDAFRQIFIEVADIVSILDENVVVSYKNTRVWPSASPHSLGIWAEAELG